MTSISRPQAHRRRGYVARDSVIVLVAVDFDVRRAAFLDFHNRTGLGANEKERLFHITPNLFRATSGIFLAESAVCSQLQ